MKTIKIVFTLLLSVSISFVYFSSTMENPLENQYQTLTQNLMDKENIVSEKELLQQYPELVAIKKQIEKIKRCQYDYREANFAPTPLEKEDGKMLLQNLDSMKIWKEEVLLAISSFELKQQRVAKH